MRKNGKQRKKITLVQKKNSSIVPKYNKKIKNKKQGRKCVV